MPSISSIFPPALRPMRMSNTLTDNVVGLRFTGYTLAGYPTYPVQLTLRCNTFGSTQAGAVGVWVTAGTPFPGSLGSSSQPNGNRFDGIADVTKRFVYDITQPIGGLPFRYYRYNSTQETFAGNGSDFYTYSGSVVSSSIATATNTQIAGTNACGGSTTPGVYARSTVNAPATGQAISVASLKEAYPNPATETVTFAYTLPNDTHSATLILRDLLGREVARQLLVEQAGEVQLSVRHLPAGFYSSVLELAGRHLASQKLTVAH